MPGTYSQLLLHIVFSTKGRTPWISGEVAERLYPYIGGIVRAEKGVLYDIGGLEDHVHLYLRWRPDGSVSDLMRTVKARSSKWMHDTFANLGAFAWQEGYSVFSVSKSQEKAVKKYVAGQAEHHKKEDFKSELRRTLRAHGVEFDEKYVFDSADASVDDSSAPAGQNREKYEGRSTGSAALHPWLQSAAPLGPKASMGSAALHGFRCAPPVATIRGPAGAEGFHGVPLRSTRGYSPRPRWGRRKNAHPGT